jgi:hypothetical protein
MLAMSVEGKDMEIEGRLIDGREPEGRLIGGREGEPVGIEIEKEIEGMVMSGVAIVDKMLLIGSDGMEIGGRVISGKNTNRDIEGKVGISAGIEGTERVEVAMSGNATDIDKEGKDSEGSTSSVVVRSGSSIDKDTDIGRSGSGIEIGRDGRDGDPVGSRG